MCIIFFLNLKKKYQLKNQLLHQKSIVRFSDLNKIEKNTNFINKINEILKNTCRHRFINDTIELDVECCKNIQYCTICEYTK